MPEYLRALCVILALSVPVFIFARAPASAIATATADFDRRRNLWFALTLVAFLAHNFWLYILIAAGLLLLASLSDKNRLALYFFALLVLPRIEDKIPGLGLIEHVFTIHYLRLLSLAVLVPAFVSLRKQPDTEPFGRSLPDKLIAAHLVLNFVLMMTANSFTNTLRNGMFYAFTDEFLPYYVASRSLKDLRQFRDALMAFVVGALVMSVLAGFEYGKGWLLYSSLEDALGRPWNQVYLMRGESLRAQTTAGHPIPLGLYMSVGLGFYLYAMKLVPNPMERNLGWLTLLGGLVAPWSRGPWVGAAVMVFAFLATGRAAVRTFVIVGLLALVGLPVLFATPYWDSLVDLIPFIGKVDAQNVTYRQKLLVIGLKVVQENLWFGDYNYYYAEEMQELKQGQGIIDVVNTYLSIALERGLVGLSIFVGFFWIVGRRMYKAMKSLPDRDGELYLLGRALLATLVGVLVIIFTCSNVGLGPSIYFGVAGLGFAYTRMLARAAQPAPATKRPSTRGVKVAPVSRAAS
jgi:O-antigen ligase